MSMIRAEQLTIGTVIVYHLRPSQHPIRPQCAWRGRIIKSFLDKAYSLDVVWVESLEEGYEGETEYVLLSQVIGIEREGENAMPVCSERFPKRTDMGSGHWTNCFLYGDGEGSAGKGDQSTPGV